MRDPTELLESIRDRRGLTGRTLLEAYRTLPEVTAVSLPPGFDDRDDLSAVVGTLTEAERDKFGFPAPVPRRPLPAPPPPAVARPVHQVRIHAILCANDDGSGGAAKANAVTAASLVQRIADLNIIYQSAGIQFSYDPATDFEEMNSSLLNLDFTPPEDLDYNLPESQPPLNKQEIRQLGRPHEEERQRVARSHCNRLVLLFADGNMLKYDDGSAKWIITKRTFAFSASDLEFVAMPTRRGSSQWWANLAAHETGHYFHIVHTHGRRPETVTEAAAMIKQVVEGGDYTVEAVEEGLIETFDGDADVVGDTPPDAGPGPFRDAFGSACGPNGTVHIPVTFSDGRERTYSLSPDRGNAVSYFKGCLNIPLHFSDDQIAIMRGVIETGNRRHLIRALECWDIPLMVRRATWAWVILIGGLMLTPGGIQPIVSKVLGVASIVLGAIGLVSSRR